MLRLLALISGLAGGVSLSQFPEFSQQYLQRLGGQADALAAVVAEFDRSATKAGLSREAALAELKGSAFLDLRQQDMRRVIARSDRASADYALLKAAGPIERLALPHRFRDRETLSATWGDFQPAIPVTLTGLTAALIGFVLGWALMFGAAALVRWPLRGAGLSVLHSLGFYVLAAFLEIAGCFAIWAWLRLDRPALWLIPGVLALILFAAALTRVETAFAGRAYAAYGGVYIAASILWLWLVEGQRPDGWDLLGMFVCLVGAGIILAAPRG